MSKNKKFVGQPILSQIHFCISTPLITHAAKKHSSNRYYKRIPLRVHLVTLLYGVFSFSAIVIAFGKYVKRSLPVKGKLAHLDWTKADANTRRSYLVFETIYFKLLEQYHSFISDSRLKGLSIRNLRKIDSATILLFSDILRGVGRNPLDGSRKNGGIKVHALMDAFSGVTGFLRITEAEEHDRKSSFILSYQLIIGAESDSSKF